MTQLLTRPGEQGWLTTPSGLAAPQKQELVATTRLQRPLTASHAQNLGGLGALIGLSVALLVFLRPQKDESTEPPAGPGAARVSGSVGQLLVAPVAQASQIEKEIGGPSVNVRFAWFGSTTDASGAPIQWPYKVLVRLGHNTVFGWRQAFPDLGFSSLTGQTQFNQTVAGETARSTFFLVPDDDNQEWDFRVWLFALRSDALGLPIGDPTAPIANNEALSDRVESKGDWMGVAFGQLPGAFRSVKPNTTATVSGSLGIVTVAQQPPRRIGSFDPAPVAR